MVTLQSEGFEIQYHSFTADPWINELKIEQLNVRFPYRKQRCLGHEERLTADRVTITGIDILALILKEELHVKVASVENALLTSFGNIQQRMGTGREGGSLRRILIDHLQVVSTRIELLDSISCSLRATTQFDIRMDEIDIKEPGKPIVKWQIGNALLTCLKIRFPEQLYTLTLERFGYDHHAKTVRIDSLRVLPDYDKVRFAKKRGVQTDRISVSIPLIEMEGAEIQTPNDLLFKANHALLNLQLEVFRDLRYPPNNKKVMALPSQLLADLPFRFQIDEIQLCKSSITYEEFPEHGHLSGTVSFDDLSAVVYNLSNSSSENTVMHAKTRFMNAGDLQVELTLPADPEKNYRAKASLTNFNLRRMNPLLISSAAMEVKSGSLTVLEFEFEYNNYRSDGELTMEYSNLDLVSLRKNSKNRSTNKFITLIIQTFIIKKDMNNSKSPGAILFYRDPHRSVFNFLWKSVLSGIKSIYNLDRIMDTHRSTKKRGMSVTSTKKSLSRHPSNISH